MSDWAGIRENVLERIKPRRAEEITLRSVGEQIVEKVDEIIASVGIEGKAELHGSVPHGTWIKGQMDLDVFIVLDEYKERGQLGEVLDAIKRNTDWDFTIAFAEHPYLQTELDGYKIDLVPCFRREPGEKIKSATDRTPLHTDWLKGRLDDLGDDVRLLKQLLKAADIYGAEIKIGGFSGYLCELLVIKYGSITGLMQAASQWGDNTVIRFNEERRVFDDPLVVYDPVDKSRNVASALRGNAYRLFVSAAKAFVENPSERFFIEDESPVDKADLTWKIRVSHLVFVVIEESHAEVPDVLWGMLRKSRIAIKRSLEERGFKVVKTSAWSNDETRHILVYQVEESDLPEVYKHYGPPVGLERNVEQFKEAYRGRSNLVNGPAVEDDTWYVVLRREKTNVKEVVSALMGDGGRGIGVSQRLAIRILQHHRVLYGFEVEPYLVDGFERHMAKLMRGRPYWVE